jgi:hypothetical protein
MKLDLSPKDCSALGLLAKGGMPEDRVARTFNALSDHGKLVARALQGDTSALPAEARSMAEELRIWANGK